MKTLRELINIIESQETVTEGYTGRETKDGTWRVFKDGQAVAVAGPFKSREEAAAWIKEKTGVAEGSNDTVYPNAQVIKSKNGRPVGEIYQDSDGTWGAFHYRADRGADGMDSREDAMEELRFIHSETGRSGPDYTLKGVAEGSTTTYVLNVMDETTGEHWSIEVQASSPDLARQRAQQQGLKVLRVKEKGVSEGDQELEETQQVEEDPVARITRLHRELNRR